MHIWNSLDQVPSGFGPSVVTLGNFDGLHRGHQHVLGQVRDIAASRNAMSVALTFDPHPALVHRPDSAPGQIMGLADKLAAMEQIGLDAVLVVPYTLDFAAQTPEEFVRSVFVETLGACTVVVGHDVRFGKANSGDLATMVTLGAQLGFDVVVVDDEGHDRRWSSTWVREALNQGDVDTAAQVLGRWHSMSGEVVHGAARGRVLGFPTANLSPDACGSIPADGVYAGWLVDEQGHRWPAAISVGSNPTFVGVSRQVEAFVIDRPEEPVEAFDLYGQHVVVEFVKRLRGMVAYTGPEALIAQMHQDVRESRQIL
ncbi:bifunctional riboflavin kinase/FAD synthetase [Arthrobacter sp. GMC3]|uniref:bifunctional riboflavin kinase/FAD synthetase n=1 Tax=Arthrobacter sp. GMC3 TaxID=2058894 RepID=UPI000CE331A4|nr:bifunctional riboflavin kinase/FAD synthetase [Arthrobacter sp. GMC3]